MPLGKVILINAVLRLVSTFITVSTNCPQHMSETIRIYSDLLSSFQEHYFQTDMIINFTCYENNFVLRKRKASNLSCSSTFCCNSVSSLFTSLARLESSAAACRKSFFASSTFQHMA